MVRPKMGEHEIEHDGDKRGRRSELFVSELFVAGDMG